VYRDVSTLLSREYSRMRTLTLQMGTSNTEAKVVCVRACRLMSLRDVQAVYQPSVCDEFARKYKMRHVRPSVRPSIVTSTNSTDWVVRKFAIGKFC